MIAEQNLRTRSSLEQPRTLRRNRWSISGVCALTLLLVAPAATTAQQDTIPGYHFDVVRIGGGGYVTGMAVHPTVPDLMYIRTDVGGGYRWDPTKQEWIQLINQNSMPDRADDEGDVGIGAIAVAPSDPDRLYLTIYDQVYISYDRGLSFSPLQQRFQLLPNLWNRWRVHGERIAVDPTNADRFLLGTRNEGLWVTDNANDFTLTEVPFGKADAGISCLIFAPIDQNNPTVTPDAYAAVVSEGIFRSIDGGQTWTSILSPAGLDGRSAEPTDLAFSSDGTLYVSFGVAETEAAPIGSVWRYRPDQDWGIGGSSWQEITPSDTWSDDYVSIAINPNRANEVILSEQGFKIAHFSNDGGLNWTTLVDGWGPTEPLRQSDIPWLLSSGQNWFEHGQLMYDPHRNDRLMVTHGQGVWFSDNVKAQADSRQRLEWTSACRGIEELVARDIVSAPGQAPLMCSMDFSVMRITDPDSYTAVRDRDGDLIDTWDADYHPTDPKIMAQVGYKFGREESALSQDGGRTWQRFESIERGTHPESLRHGSIAVNAAENGKETAIVWCPAAGFQAPPFFSLDLGKTWNRVQTWPLDSEGLRVPTGFWFEFFVSKCIISDPHVPGRFLMYLKAEGGLLIESRDNGRNWRVLSEDLPMWGHNCVLKAIPQRPGEFLFAGGAGQENLGVWRSTDNGLTFQQLPDITSSIAIDAGPSAPGSTIPTLFLLGGVNGVKGVWRSTDDAQSWQPIVIGQVLGLLDNASVMAADQNEFGRFFIGFRGTGFAYGELREQNRSLSSGSFGEK